MKKLIFTPVILMGLTVLMGADFHRQNAHGAKPPAKEKKFCNGYTIVEFGKGIDCNGDTVKLVKINGVQEMVTEPS